MTRYYHPDEFRELKRIAMGLGFVHVEAGPLVRSSYHAHEQADAAEAALADLTTYRARSPWAPRSHEHVETPSSRNRGDGPRPVCLRAAQGDPRVAELQKELATMKQDLAANKDAQAGAAAGQAATTGTASRPPSRRRIRLRRRGNRPIGIARPPKRRWPTSKLPSRSRRPQPPAPPKRMRASAASSKT